jgi:hypothetical protein
MGDSQGRSTVRRMDEPRLISIMPLAGNVTLHISASGIAIPVSESLSE